MEYIYTNIYKVIDLDNLTDDILNSSISDKNLNWIRQDIDDTKIIVSFKNELSNNDNIILNTVVANNLIEE